MSMIAPFPSNSSPSLFHGTSFPTIILPKPIITGFNDTISDTTNIFCQIRRIINNYDEFPSDNAAVLNVLKTEVHSNINRLSKLLKNLSLNLTAEQIKEIESLRSDGKILLSELGQEQSDIPFITSESKTVNEESLKEIYAQFNEIKRTFSKLLIFENITAENVDLYVSTRKDICNDLMEKKIIIEQLMDKDGLRYSNYNVIIFIKEFERTLQMISEAIFQLEEAVKKFKLLGNFKNSLESVKNLLLQDENNMSKRKAEKIRRQLEHCQEVIDAFEIVCNNLTAHLSELAAISGDSIISQEADYLIELQDFKTELHDIRQKFEKALIRPKHIETKAMMKEVSTNTIPLNSRSISTSTDLPKEIRIKEASEIPAIKAARSFRSKQFLLGFLPVLLFGLTFLTLFSERQQPNNWRKMYGPQLDYYSLPPQ